jgi:dCMP deaminase
MANEFSKDESTKVGALFLKPNTLNILSIGYNGFPRGVNEKIKSRWKRPLKYKYVEHAERNAIYNAALHETCLEDSILFVTMFPCCDCARAIIQSGVKVLITLDFDEYSKDKQKRWNDDWKISMEMFDEVGIKVILLKNSEIDD